MSHIVEKLKKLDKSYYLYKVVGGKHELSNIPFDHLNNVFSFFLKMNVKIIKLYC